MIDLSKIIINKMELNNLDEIKDKLFENFDDFWSYEIFKEELANNNSTYLVLRYNDEIICYGGIKKILDEAELMNIVTRKDMRGMRICSIFIKCYY